jgi:dTDP-4-dehydrorhamnose reductase
MRILLLGKFGQLGWELCRTLAPLGEIVSIDYPEIDLSADESTIRETVREIAPNLIVNATAYNAVDRAEQEYEIATMINARAPGLLAEEALSLGAALIHYSTDYVFDGSKGDEYIEMDEPNPLGAYGRSKLEGERSVVQVGGSYLILRTSWVYSLRRESFVTKVLQWSRQQSTLRVVSDQVSKPTWSRMLAETTAQLLAGAKLDVAGWISERRGIYHLAGSGKASRLEWAQAILKYDPRKEEQLTQEIVPAKTSDFPTPAQRPLYSPLSCKKFTSIFKLRLPDWEEALRLAMENN